MARGEHRHTGRLGTSGFRHGERTDGVPAFGPGPRPPRHVGRRLALAAAGVIVVLAASAFVPGDHPATAAATREALPEMCNGRSDPSLRLVAEATGHTGAGYRYFLDLASNTQGAPAGSMVLVVGSSRLVVTDWCRAWQHIPGQTSKGDCTPPEGATTGHAIGTAEFRGVEMLVRTDVRETLDGNMTFRVRYRPLATSETTATDDCEEGWTMVPPEGWAPLADMSASTQVAGSGYETADTSGAVRSFGTPFLGSASGVSLNGPVVAMAADPGTGGYWLAAADGGVFAFGAPFSGSLSGHSLNRPVVAMAADPVTSGYWLAAADGGVFALGETGFRGSLADLPLAEDVVGIADDPATGGYWLAAADGGVFAFGAPYRGSLGGVTLASPITGIAATPSGQGYWLVAADGSVYVFGDALFEGDLGGLPLDQPVVGIARTLSGKGYWLVAADGGVFAFGDAGFHGSSASTPSATPTSGIASG